MPNKHAEIVKELIDKNVEYCFINYLNIHGTCMGKIVPIDKLDYTLTNGGVFFAGVQDDGLCQEPHEVEVSAIGSLENAIIMPWNNKIVWLPASLHRYKLPHPQCSRNILNNVISQYIEKNIEVSVGIELEFYLLKNLDETPVPYVDNEPQIPAYNLSGTLETYNFWSKVLAYSKKIGWDILTFNHEGGKSQLEFSLHHLDPLTSADQYVFFKTLISEVAKEQGLIATFMPKPFENDLGSSVHINLSIKSQSAKKTMDERYGLNLFDIEYNFIGGILNNAKAITAIACPTVNSYKRLTSKLSDVVWSPKNISYGDDNRTCMIRVVPRDSRIEFRLADTSCNIYLTLAAVLVSALDGIKKSIDPKQPLKTNVERNINVTDQYNEAVIPSNLIDALSHLAKNSILIETFSETLVNDFIKIKTEEWHSYFNHISKWEINKYLYW